MEMRLSEELLYGFDSLVIFRHLLDDPLIAAYRSLADRLCKKDTAATLTAYGAFAAELYARGGCLSDCLLGLLTEDDNLFVRRLAAKKPIPTYMWDCLDAELTFFSRAARLTRADILEDFPLAERLADWDVRPVQIGEEYRRRIAALDRYGYGIYAKYTSFIVRDGAIVPVKHPDNISLDDLKDYENERQQVLDNTAALVEGRPAQNVLLSGDAGTGKSSTVKAVANHFAPMGLRLVQMTKNQLHDLPIVLDELSANPLKFILFIDDLSFSNNDDDFGALKAALEGSVSARSANTAIYVTSNRRHLVRESFSNRDGDEIHHNDTIQEITSLSDRFGLTITYVKPDKKIYLDIVLALAEQYRLPVDREELCAGAEIFAVRKGGRSPRAAKQYIDSIRGAAPDTDDTSAPR